MRPSRLVFGGVLLAIAAACAAPDLAGQDLRAASPDSVGMSSDRLARLSAAMQRAVDDAQVAGIVTLVARRGKIVHFAAFGKQDLEKGVPMAKDTIFRIASQTKAVTSVAAMMLVEEGRLLLS